jgi:hypothetical protein
LIVAYAVAAASIVDIPVIPLRVCAESILHPNAVQDIDLDGGLFLGFGVFARDAYIFTTILAVPRTIQCEQIKMAQAWIEIHHDESLANWQLAVAGEQPFRIALLQ